MLPEQSGLTLTEMATRLGRDKGRLSKYENNHIGLSIRSAPYPASPTRPHVGPLLVGRPVGFNLVPPGRLGPTWATPWASSGATHRTG
jgi:hypothetical protein